MTSLVAVSPRRSVGGVDEIPRVFSYTVLKQGSVLMTMTDMPSLHFKREELLAALEARLPWAKALDAKNLAKHQRDERSYEKAFRAACKEAMKWDCAAIKRHYGIIMPRNNRSAPSCPLSVVVKLERAIQFVRDDRRKTCSLSSRGEWSAVYWLLTYNEKASKADLC